MALAYARLADASRRSAEILVAHRARHADAPWVGGRIASTPRFIEATEGRCIADRAEECIASPS
jgi:hypothetical protein